MKSFALRLLLCMAPLASAFAAGTTYTYDALNRLTRVTYASSVTISYSYDSSGNRLTMSVCSVSLGSASAAFRRAGGTGSIEVTAPAGCAWTASSNSAFLTIQGTASGTGSGTVQYSVAVNGTGAPRSGTITIGARTFTVEQTIASPPSVTLHPSSRTVSAGNDATFSATADAEPSASWQWQGAALAAEFSDLTNGGSFIGVTTATLTVHSSAALDGMQFRAIASNGIGTAAVTNPATLTVHYGPAFTTEPTDKTVTSGGIASFTAIAKGNPMPSYRWQRGDGQGGFVDLSEGGAYANVSGSTLSVTTSSSLNGTTYRAVATNGEGEAASSTATLIVHFAPVITQQPTDSHVMDGADAVFTTAASGNPAPSVQWQRQNQDGSFSDLSEGAPFSGVATAALQVRASASLNGALFRAAATNGVAPDAISSTVQLTVGVKGDANGDSSVGPADIFYLINHLFAGGPPAVGPSDVNGDGSITPADIFYLINHLFGGGPPPR